MKHLHEIMVLLLFALTVGRAHSDPAERAVQPDSRPQRTVSHDPAQAKSGAQEKKQASAARPSSKKKSIPLFSGYSPKDTSTVLAKIGDKTIFVDEFIRRAEYTIRPSYCKGNGGIEKKIVLNSLLAEKMLALEAGKENKLAKSEVFQRMLQGRKEQLMREVLHYAEGMAKVKLDTAKSREEYKIAGRTYNLEYFNVPNDSDAATIKQILDTSSASFNDIYRALSGRDSLPPQRDVNWNSRENEAVHGALFQGLPKVNQIIGPLPANDENNLFIRVKGWTDHVAVTEKQIAERRNDVNEELSRSQANEHYDEYTAQLMSGKTLQFDPEAFKKIVDILAPLYLESAKEKEQTLSRDLLKRSVEVDQKARDVERNLHALHDQTLFRIDNKVWTMEDVSREMERHPLVFRSRNLNPKNIAKHLKFAIVDMVRDRYLADEAYRRGYDKVSSVVHYTEMWEDAILGLWQKSAYLESIGVTDNGQMDMITKYLNPYVDSLRRKYNDRTEIDAAAFNEIKLTRIDMIALQNNVPFAVFVPSFPQLTTHKWLDYGRDMNQGRGRSAAQTNTSEASHPLPQP